MAASPSDRVFGPGRRLLYGLFVAGATLSAVAASLYADLLDAERDFRLRVDGVHRQLTWQVGSEDAILTTLAGLQHATRVLLDKDEFIGFAAEILTAHPFVQSISYLERIEPDRRAAFEREMRLGGLPGFHFARPVRSGDASAGNGLDLEPVPGPTPNPLAASYLPITAVEPLEPDFARLLGLDAWSVPTYAEAVAAAVVSGRAVASRPLDLVQGGRGFSVFKAIYQGRSIPADATSRRRRWTAVVALHNEAERFFAPLLVANPGLGLRVSFPQSSAPGGESLLFERQMEGSPGFAGLGRAIHFSQVRAVRTQLTDYRLEVTAFPGLTVFQPGFAATMGLLAALLGSLLTYAQFARRRGEMLQGRARDALDAEKERAEVTLHSIGDAVMRIDDRQRIEYLNPAAELLIGASRRNAVGKALDEVIELIAVDTGVRPSDPPSAATDGSPGASHLALGTRAVELHRPDGETRAIDLTAGPIHDRAGAVVGTVLAFRDVGVERRLTDQLAYQASHDALTGLANRSEFERQVGQALEEIHRTRVSHALCYMDLDQFKIVNDTCGHGAGDLLLRQVSELLREHIRKSDLLARLGGDEFGVLLRNCDLERATDIAWKVCRAVRDYRFHWQGQSFDVRISIGLVRIDVTSGNLTALFSAADSACYIAKEKGRDNVHVSAPDDRSLAERHGEMQWLQRIREAIDQDGLTLFGQHIRRLNPTCEKERIVEFSLRMCGPNGTLIAPMAFLPAAERYDIVRDIDRWVVDRALGILARTNADDRRGLLFNIKFSGPFLGDSASVDYVLERLRAEAAGEGFCVEISESSAFANLSEVMRLARAVKGLGGYIALNDFSCGLNAFSLLKQLPLDYLKIGGGHIVDVLRDPVDQAMLGSINDLGHMMGIQTIAGFVEDARTLAKLEAIGVDYAQGYHIHRPAPASEVV